ncbi:hypothetical protein VOLCADRAFT_96440 [Volvox carteri f. nagariensis]|uniref:Nuclear speckle splicing regulatory protein 1 N-terminal domain-containing protein n=1 Tax=Volvox carteri f. nagariensis TaxID=3068 RepID=D8UA41_VOLCA|nr:uncharacterized protein VOLCADRAFT_96440 [Volvox carteri f. nagariensis]EFJ43409.1 hypothetical protein VOLCADRAFT_96440 [Volvox carteri f. nagariensis]|eukprot:XP_002955556.1 hypothetical protein VOLCADRAFT_96440 [Volvox carteri f. nagariensis]
MIIGQKGVQYGLQKVVPKKPGLQASASSQRKVAPANVFGDDDSDEEDVERQIARQADKKRAAAKVQQVYEEALAEDPSVFDYDGVYDSIQEARVTSKQQDKVQRQSKYIASLLEQAQQRKREQDVLYERRMVKERQQEDHLFEDKERFVTSAYRKKLEEDKKWLEAERQKELEEQRNDVRKVGHMGNFYANLLTKNVAYGTAKSNHPADRDENEEEKAEEEAAAAAGGGGGGGGAAGAEGRGGSEGRVAPAPVGGSDSEGGGGGDDTVAAASRNEAAAGSSQAKVLSQLDRYDRLRLEAEKALIGRKLAQQQQQQKEKEKAELGEGQNEERTRGSEGPGSRGVEEGGKLAADQQRRPPGASEGDEAAAAAQAAVRRRGGGDALPPSSSGGGGVLLPPPQPVGAADLAAAAVAAAAAGGSSAMGSEVVIGGKRRNDEAAVLSARERYLARKQPKMS